MSDHTNNPENPDVEFVPQSVAIDLPLVDIDRSPAAVTKVVERLRENPGRRVAWSKHQTRGAARQRVAALRRSAMFRPHPDVRFETRSAEPYNQNAEIYILISVGGSNHLPTLRALEEELVQDLDGVTNTSR